MRCRSCTCYDNNICVQPFLHTNLFDWEAITKSLRHINKCVHYVPEPRLTRTRGSAIKYQLGVETL